MCATLEKVTLWRQKSEHCFWVQIIHLKKKKWWKNKQFEKSDTSKTICYFFGRNIIFVFFFFCKNQFTHCVLCIFVYNVFHGAEMTGATNAVGKKNSSSQLRQKRENLGRFHHCYENMNTFSALSVLFIFSKSQTNLVTEIRHAQYQFNKCVCLCVCV